MHRIKNATLEAISDPYTWVPAAAAAVTQIGTLDHDISRWAADTNPLYGSQATAKDASDLFLDANRIGMVITGASVQEGGEQWNSRIKRLFYQPGGIVLTHSSTLYVKRVTARERPDGSSYASFPSAHTSGSAAFATMSNANLEHIPMPQQRRKHWQQTFTLMAAGTAWGRVEANKHYSSDVLAGYAVGNFFSRLVNDAILENNRFTSAVSMQNESILLNIQKTF